jgi:pimeloyl-ACP methyl ester carboxylesterase
LELPEPDRAELVDLGRTIIRLWHWGDPAQPPVLLVHGGWDHGRMWDGIAPRIATLGYHAVAIDVRGHGDSGRLHTSGTYWQMFQLDLAQVARHLSAGPRVRVIGHSFGGGLSMSMAAGLSDHVEQVVNIDGLGPPPEMMIVEDHAASASQWIKDAERLWSEPAREYASVEEMAQKRKAINTRLPIEWCRHLARHGSKPGPHGGLIWKSDQHMRLGSPGPFSDESLRAQYVRIRCPVLVLTGTEPDQWNDLPVEARDARLAAIPDVRHHEVAGAGHYVHIEQPDAVIELVAAFFGP